MIRQSGKERSAGVMAGGLVLVAMLATGALGQHDWDAWQAVSTWQKPAPAGAQAGRSELVPLLCDSEGQTLNSIAGWEAKRAGIGDAISAILGEPTDLEPPEVEVEVLDSEQLDGYQRRHIRIRGEPEDWITAYLLIPDDLQPGKHPAMIALHQTVPWGKREPVGLEGDAELAFAEQLVQRGYICVAPDAIGFGERTPEGAPPYHESIRFFERHPGWSFMGKMNWDVARVVDYLRTLEQVDPYRIGVIGHSHGAYGAIFAAAFEPRISAVIASCGFTTFRADPTPERWSHLTALMPQLGHYLPDADAIPFEWHEITAMVAPRPMFVWYGLKDAIFPETDNLDEVFTEVQGVFGLYGAQGDLAWHAYQGGHNFPPAARARAYDWLDARMGGARDLDCEPTGLSDWHPQREQIRRAILRDIGPLPEEAPSLEVQVLSEEAKDGYQQRLIEYAVMPGERVRAYLLVPDEVDGPRPGVLAMHSTSPEGKEQPVGISENPDRSFGLELVQRGYVVLAPDYIAAGDRVDPRYGAFDTRGHYERYPRYSAFGKMLHESKRALAVLEQLDAVDAQRLGAIGHSLGAENAMMLAAFDERVKATIASCGYATFAAEANPQRWARDQWFSYMPKLRPVLRRGELPIWDWHHVVRLIAPRGYFQFTGSEDDIFPEGESAHEAAVSSRTIWALYDASDRLVSELEAVGHDFPEPARRRAYDWLDAQLKLPRAP